jgi:predicted SnoaL-like aldol condensation-catalyzing enzyme
VRRHADRRVRLKRHDRKSTGNNHGNMEVHRMAKTIAESNKVLVLEAFDTLFNKRDYKAAERYWPSNYIQHSTHIPPGRDGLFNLIRSTPPTLKHEPGVIVAENDYVIVHGRFSGTGRPRNWIAADVVRVTDGVLVEHWDAARRSDRSRVAKRSADVRGQVSGLREASSLRQFTRPLVAARFPVRPVVHALQRYVQTRIEKRVVMIPLHGAHRPRSHAVDTPSHSPGCWLQYVHDAIGVALGLSRWAGRIPPS